MRIDNYKAHRGKNGFQGYFDLILNVEHEGGKVNLICKGWKIFEKDDGSRFVSPPQDKWERYDGTVGYTNLIDYLDRDAEQAIHELVFTELDRLRGTEKPAPEAAEETAITATDEDVPF